MNLPFEIELYESGRSDSLYTFRHLDRDVSELDRFLEDPHVRRNPDFHRLVDRLTKGVDRRRGYRRWWFRPEGPVEALFAPYPKEEKEALNTPYPPSLRLYCVRRMDVVLAGHGGIKTTRTYQDDERLHRAVKELAYVDRRLQERIDMGLVWFEHDSTLNGDLTFS